MLTGVLFCVLLLLRLADVPEHNRTFDILADKRHDQVIGSIHVRLSFPFYTDHLPELSTALGSSSISGIPVPTLDAPSFGLSPESAQSNVSSSIDSSPMSSAKVSIIGRSSSLPMNNTSPKSTATSYDTSEPHYLRSRSMSSSTSSANSMRSTYSTKSLLKYGGFSENTVMGFKEFAGLMSAAFGSGWNMSKIQLLKSYILVSKYLNEHRQFPYTRDFVTDSTQLEIAGYFVHYSLATYGAFLINYFGFGSGLMSDFVRSKPDRKAALAHLKLKSEHLLKWDFGALELFHPNYFVCYDERTKAIVLSLRGTLNFQEVLLDAICDYVPFKGGLVHRGFLRSAVWLEENLLPSLKSWLSQFQATNLHLVGHSMGAGVVSLFRMMLDDHVLSPDRAIPIRTYCFATTATASKNLCDAYKPHISTFINERDLVPRVSFGSVKDFQDLVQTASGLIDSRLPNSDKMDALEKRHQELLDSDAHPKLYPPGTVYYLYKSSRSGLISEQEPHYVCERSDGTAFIDCHFGENAFMHHFIDKYDNSLRKVILSYFVS